MRLHPDNRKVQIIDAAMKEMGSPNKREYVMLSNGQTAQMSPMERFILASMA